jgi:hypothetical protein
MGGFGPPAARAERYSSRMVTTARRIVPLLAAAAALACSGKKEAPPASAPAAPPTASAPAPRPAAPAADFAKAMTEDKLARLLAFEQEILPLTREVVGGMGRVARAAGGDAKKVEGAISRDERMKQLSEQISAAQAKHGVTQQDQALFATATTDLLVKEMFATSARKQLAENEPKKEAWAKAEAAYEAKHKDDPRAAPYAFTAKKGTAPLMDVVEQQLREQIAEAEAARKAFAEKNGQEALDRLAPFIPRFVEVREQQMAAVMKPQ